MRPSPGSEPTCDSTNSSTLPHQEPSVNQNIPPALHTNFAKINKKPVRFLFLRISFLTSSNSNDDIHRIDSHIKTCILAQQLRLFPGGSMSDKPNPPVDPVLRDHINPTDEGFVRLLSHLRDYVIAHDGYIPNTIYDLLTWICPQASFELAILQRRQDGDCIFLAERTANDGWHGQLHMPGTILRSFDTTEKAWKRSITDLACKRTDYSDARIHPHLALEREGVRGNGARTRSTTRGFRVISRSLMDSSWS